MRYAIVNDGIVTNVIAWDGISLLKLQPGLTAVALGDRRAAIGWSYSGAEFTPPAPVVEQEQT